MTYTNSNTAARKSFYSEAKYINTKTWGNMKNFITAVRI